jgi:hypothetical protein
VENGDGVGLTRQATLEECAAYAKARGEPRSSQASRALRWFGIVPCIRKLVASVEKIIVDSRATVIM